MVHWERGNIRQDSKVSNTHFWLLFSVLFEWRLLWLANFSSSYTDGSLSFQLHITVSPLLSSQACKRPLLRFPFKTHADCGQPFIYLYHNPFFPFCSSCTNHCLYSGQIQDSSLPFSLVNSTFTVNCHLSHYHYGHGLASISCVIIKLFHLKPTLQ